MCRFGTPSIAVVHLKGLTARGAEGGAAAGGAVEGGVGAVVEEAGFEGVAEAVDGLLVGAFLAVGAGVAGEGEEGVLAGGEDVEGSAAGGGVEEGVDEFLAGADAAAAGGLEVGAELEAELEEGFVLTE